MGRREDKRELTRQQMLDAARVLFIERGYENTSLEDISEKANVSKGTFYYHFESKEDLVVHLRRSLVKDTVDNAFDLLHQGQSPITALEKLLLDRALSTESIQNYRKSSTHCVSKSSFLPKMTRCCNF